MDIVVLLPKGHCTKIQELQMTTVLRENVHVFGGGYWHPGLEDSMALMRAGLQKNSDFTALASFLFSLFCQTCSEIGLGLRLTFGGLLAQQCHKLLVGKKPASVMTGHPKKHSLKPSPK